MSRPLLDCKVRSSLTVVVIWYVRAFQKERNEIVSCRVGRKGSRVIFSTWKSCDSLFDMGNLVMLVSLWPEWNHHVVDDDVCYFFGLDILLMLSSFDVNVWSPWHNFFLSRQNHTLFWENLTPEETAPGPETTAAIKEAFGDLEAFKADMSAKSVAVQGSGWGWLGYNKATKRLEIATCANQDPLQATTGLVPLLGIDVWEHAYYLDYKNVRPDYVKSIWNVINWKTVESRLVAAK